MRTAIITGASSGLGREFVFQLTSAFPEIERVILIARRKALLEELAEGLSIEAECLPLDLCKPEDLESLREYLARESPEVELLINCAGCGYLSNVAETDPALLDRMIDLNVRALTAVTRAAAPYLVEGGHIINASSIASFCPNPRMTVYSSTKAYVSFFSLGLREELRSRKVSVTAVCPGPMDTEFLDIGGITGNSPMFKMLPHCDPKKVAAGSYTSAKAGRAVYTPKGFFKLYRAVSKVVPLTLLVKMTKT